MVNLISEKGFDEKSFPILENTKDINVFEDKDFREHIKSGRLRDL